MEVKRGQNRMVSLSLTSSYISSVRRGTVPLVIGVGVEGKTNTLASRSFNHYKPTTWNFGAVNFLKAINIAFYLFKNKFLLTHVY